MPNCFFLFMISILSGEQRNCHRFWLNTIYSVYILIICVYLNVCSLSVAWMHTRTHTHTRLTAIKHHAFHWKKYPNDDDCIFDVLKIWIVNLCDAWYLNCLCGATSVPLVPICATIWPNSDFRTFETVESYKSMSIVENYLLCHKMPSCLAGYWKTRIADKLYYIIIANDIFFYLCVSVSFYHSLQSF